MSPKLQISGNDVVTSGTAVLTANDTLQIFVENVIFEVVFRNVAVSPQIADISINNLENSVTKLTYYLEGFNNPLGSTFTIPIGTSEDLELKLRLFIQAVQSGGEVGARNIGYTILTEKINLK